MKNILILCASMCIFNAANAADCMISVDNPTFGVYQSFTGHDALTTGTISRTGSGCDSIPYTLQLTKGNGSTYQNRRLQSLNDSLGYNVYLDTGRTAVFGDGTESTVTVNTSANSVPIYGKIPGGQMVTPGEYTDSLSISIVY